MAAFGEQALFILTQLLFFPSTGHAIFFTCIKAILLSPLSG